MWPSKSPTKYWQPLPPATLTETWRPATRLRPEQVSLDARQVDLAGDDWRVLLSDPLLDSLRALLGEKAVEVVM